MSDVLTDLERKLADAVRQFWTRRGQQAEAQGKKAGGKDRGGRSAVTGGKHLDGFRELVAKLLNVAGLEEGHVYWQQKTELPGWYRATKSWDLLVVADQQLVAVLEVKSHIESFGNNANNRFEEAIGNAVDLWAAYEEGAFEPSDRPWLGYLMLLEDAPGATTRVRVKEPHFKVFPEFKDASYATRYELLLTKLVRGRKYDACCFLMSSQTGGSRGEYREPSAELSFRNFASSLLARAQSVALMKPSGLSAPPKLEPRPGAADADAG